MILKFTNLTNKLYGIFSFRRIFGVALIVMLYTLNMSNTNNNCVYVITNKIATNDPVRLLYKDFNINKNNEASIVDKAPKSKKNTFSTPAEAIAYNRYANIKVPTKKDPRVVEFVDKWYSEVKKMANDLELDQAVYMGVLILESAFGTSELARNAKNYSGIKCKGKDCLGDKYFTPYLKEVLKLHSLDPYYYDGNNYMSFNSDWVGIKFTGLFLKSRIEMGHPNYKYFTESKNKSTELFAYNMLRCGWSETNDYDIRLMRIIKQYEL